MNMRAICLTAMLSVPFSSGATEYIKETKLTWVSAQAIRPIQPSTQSREYISLAPGTWSVNGGSGGTACNEVAAVLPDNNPTVRAIALAAIASGATVSVAVDNTLPMLNSICQVSMLSIKGN